MVTKHEYEQCAIRNRRLLMWSYLMEKDKLCEVIYETGDCYENCKVNFVRKQAMWSYIMEKDKRKTKISLYKFDFTIESTSLTIKLNEL
jgi:hypothetical protein